MWKKKHQWLSIFRTSIIISVVSLGIIAVSALAGLSTSAGMIPYSERDEQNQGIAISNQPRSALKIRDYEYAGVAGARYANGSAEQTPQLDSPINSSAPLESIIDRNNTTSSSVLQADLTRVSSSPTPLGGSGLDYPYSGSGNWNISSDTVVWNEEITLDGNLFIQNGGNLTLQNVTLKINSPSGQHYRIQVDSGCHLTIRENSTVTAVNTADEWYLLAKTGSTLLLENSSFSYAGWAAGTDGDQSGLWINTAGARVINCTIQNNWVGLRLHRANDCLIANNTITDSVSFPSWGIRFEKSNQTVVHGNTFQFHTFGIVLADSYDCILSNNTIEYASYGMDLSTWENEGNNTVRGNTISDITIDGIILGLSANNTLANNKISRCGKSGISLNGSGNVIVSDNIISESSLYGILLDSFDCFLMRNTINDSGNTGITLVGWYYAADNNIISDNIVTYSFYWGIFLNNAGNNTITRNTLANSGDVGILLNSSLANLNAIYLNNIYDNGGMQASNHGSVNAFSKDGLGNYWGDAYTGADFDGDGVGNSWYWLDSDVDRYPLIYPTEQYWVVKNEETVENKDIIYTGYLKIQAGGDLTLRNATLRINCSFDGQYRIEVANGASLSIKANSIVTAFVVSEAWYLIANASSTLLLENSAFSYAGWEEGTNGDHSGLWVGADGAQILNCSIHHNYVGLYFYQAENCLITENTITNSTEYGIYLSKLTANCMLWGNALADNAVNANDTNGTNQWDNGSYGNWWDTYIGVDTDYNGIGDSSYSIPNAGAEDRYPLMVPPTFDTTPPFVDSPDDLTYGLGTLGHNITWQPSDSHPNGYVIYRNNSVYATDGWNGSAIIIFIDEVPFGLHNFTIVVYDVAGNWASDTVWVDVADIIPPIVTIGSPTNSIYTTSTILLHFSGDADHYWYYIENVDTMNHSWTTSVNRTLEDGDYTLHVYGNDSAGNELHIWVSFTIDTIPPTVMIMGPFNATYAKPIIDVALSGDATTYWYRLVGPSGHENTSWTTTVTTGNLADGSYTLYAYGVDLAGNEGHASVTFSIKADANVIVEIVDGITGANNTYEVSETITVGIAVSSEATVTIRKVATGPRIPSTLDSLDVYLDITLSDSSLLTAMWINVSFGELPAGEDPAGVRIYYYDETENRWELVKETGIDNENEIIWGRTDHLSSFGLMRPHHEEPGLERNELFLLFLGGGSLLLIIAGIFLVRYTNLKDQLKEFRKRMREGDWQDQL